MRLVPTMAAVLAVALAFAACGEKSEPELGATPTADRFQITGEWSGRLTQKGMQPFEVTATIASLARSKHNTVRYSGLDCSGTWDYLGASETAYRFGETIDRGKSHRCKGMGTVTLEPVAQNRVAYSFSGGGVESRGALDRRGG